MPDRGFSDAVLVGAEVVDEDVEGLSDDSAARSSDAEVDTGFSKLVLNETEESAYSETRFSKKFVFAASEHISMKSKGFCASQILS